jgi:TM2 domain-containing membrane protein YozV
MKKQFLTLVFVLCSIVNWAVDPKPIRYFQKAIGNENPRAVAIALDITLGYFGVHRMYLGTDPKVPIFYTLSMGGGGLLWLVDLGILIAHKDIEPYINNPRMFMWAGKN